MIKPTQKPVRSQINTGEAPAPGLYLVATPIGNLQDITLRALAVLRGCDLIACEDTRVTRTLANHYGLTAPLLSYHDHNATQRGPQIMHALAECKAVALVSDAGTPLVSDPGYLLVREAVAQDIPVFPIPGASSLLAALCASGLPSDHFYFAGFLPTKKEACRRALSEAARIPGSLVFFESPRRLTTTLTLMHETLGDRPAAVARELTKLHENICCGTLARLAEQYAASGPPKGEVVIVTGPPLAAQSVSEDEIEALLRKALREHSLKDAVRNVSDALNAPRNEVYAKALTMTKSRHA